MKSRKRDSQKAVNQQAGDYQELPEVKTISERQVKAASSTSERLTDPLVTSSYEQPDPVARRNTPTWFRDLVSLAIFIAVIVIGAWLLNHFVFQSFNVVGGSMEPTLEGENGVSDRLIVNRLPITAAMLSGKEYVPTRCEIIVFKNPINGDSVTNEEYLVKRVIGLPGERVTVNDCQLLVHNDQHPEGFDPYPSFTNLGDGDSVVNTCVDGDGTDTVVPNNHVFVVGDHRVGNHSMDSRDGGSDKDRYTIGTVPLDDIIGPVAMRIWPINKLTLF